MAILGAVELQTMKQSPAAAAVSRRVMRRRRISPQAGHALEMLGHAIDYLTDEYVHQGGRFTPGDPQWQAIQLLMGMNRQIYLECPEVPTLKERLMSLLHLAGAAVR